MSWEKLKEFWNENESPQVFWPTYIIFLTVMILLIYYSSMFESAAFWGLLPILVGTGILFPLTYLYKQRNKK